METEDVFGNRSHGINWNDWDYKELDSDGEKRRLRKFEDEPALQSKLDLLRGFRNLERLRFNRCPDVADDDVMRFTVTQMTSCVTGGTGSQASGEPISSAIEGS